MVGAIHSLQQVSLPILDTADLFPVHRIYCVGRNYAAHAVEMGHDPDREGTVLFSKKPRQSCE